MFCRYCGAENPDDAKFCSACGQAQAELTPKSEEGTGKAGGFYWVSVLFTIAVFILRIIFQTDYHTSTIFENTYYYGIMDQNVKWLFSAIPAIAFIISALRINSSQTTKEQKGKALLINGILVIVMLLLIWISIPKRLIDF